MEETSGPRRYVEEEFDLREYVGVLFKHWKLIALVAFLAAFSAGVVSFLTPPTYEATDRGREYLEAFRRAQRLLEGEAEASGL